MPYILLAVGVMLLLAGGTTLVRGASGIARSFNVSTVIIGLTVVAFGTSTPELVVNVTGALSNETDLAFGNAVGSNLANFGLVLGIAALITPIYLQSQIVRREVPYLLLITAILMVMAADQPLSGLPSILDRGDSIILLLLFTIFVYIMIRDIINGQGDPIFREADEYQASRLSGGYLINGILIIIGIAMLATGGQMTIVQGATIAQLHNVPEVVIGIFVVAVGTSLPELVTSVIAAYKDESDLALGNIVGSNIFNSLVVLPAAGIIRPIPVPGGGALDLAVGFLFVLVVIPLFFFSQARLGRLAGAGLLTTYVIYMLYRFSS